jgi:hypothetical protein
VRGGSQGRQRVTRTDRGRARAVSEGIWGNMSENARPDDENVPLADRRAEQLDQHEEPDFAEESTASPTDPAGQPEADPDGDVYGEDEGYEKPTSV